MLSRTWIALLLLLPACAATKPVRNELVTRNPRIANLQRAAALPWTDDGRCVVQHASNPWPAVVERCFYALDTGRIRFHDIERRCTVASADAASLQTMVGLCLLAQPELLVGAVIVIGVVVAAVAIKEALDAYELSDHPEDAKPVPETRPRPGTKPVTQEPTAEPTPKPEASPPGTKWPPPVPTEPPGPERSECTPRPVPHLGGDVLHNQCADRVPQRDFPGSDVLVGGKHFDAVQLRARVLWEVKTDKFDSYTPDLQEIVIKKQVAELLRELNLAKACGFDFRVGVRSATHKVELERQTPELAGRIVVMDWC